MQEIGKMITWHVWTYGRQLGLWPVSLGSEQLLYVFLSVAMLRSERLRSAYPTRMSGWKRNSQRADCSDCWLSATRNTSFLYWRDCPRGHASDLHSACAGFESRPRHRLSLYVSDCFPQSYSGQGTMLQAGRSWVRDPMKWMIIFNIPNLSGRTRPWVSLRNEYQKQKNNILG
jgi:hypothetical protein